MKFHAVFVVEMPHDLDFFDEAFLSVFLAEGSFLGEGLDCAFLLGIVSFGEIDGGEVSFSDFFDGFEVLVEASLLSLIHI